MRKNSMRKVYFRADAGSNIGYGHFIRSLALADMLKEDFDCTFFTQAPTEYQQQEVAKVCKLQELPSTDEKFNLFLSYLDGSEIVVLDNYFFGTDYQQEIKNKGCKLICIDDMHDKHYVADIVINHGLQDYRLFDVEDYTRLCLGLEWALLRQPFLSVGNVKKEKDSWLVSFGGTDWKNLTGKFLQILSNNRNIKKITVVIGDGFQFTTTLPSSPKITLKRNLSAQEMANEMILSEFAILPASTVCIEALACKCKILCGYYVDNQKEIYHNFNREGRIFPLGDLTQYSSEDIIIPNQLIADNTFSRNIQYQYIQLIKELQ